VAAPVAAVARFSALAWEVTPQVFRTTPTAFHARGGGETIPLGGGAGLQVIEGGSMPRNGRLNQYNRSNRSSCVSKCDDLELRFKYFVRGRL
jgi:hypothetical protein